MKPKKINLALQGGGSHGAYSWGVIERLLEDERIEIEGVSGTSAGAMNAAILASGYAKGGRQGAIKNLEKFWRSVSELGAFGPYNKSWLERMATGWNMEWSPAYNALDMMSRVFSPYDLNPLNINPLSYILDEMIDFEGLCASSPIKLFITATHVESGQARVFHREEIDANVILASACIPFMFQAVEVEGEYYWDGGYMGNPTIWPLIYNCHSEDVLLVQINPIHRDQVPKKSYEIINRLNEITFNSSLIAEMRAIHFVSELLKQGKLNAQEYKDMRMHLIYSAEEMKDLDASSKLNTSWDFFMYLKSIGRNATSRWLEEHFDDIGVKSSLDITDKFLHGAPNRKHSKELKAVKQPKDHKKPAAIQGKHPAGKPRVNARHPRTSGA